MPRVTPGHPVQLVSPITGEIITVELVAVTPEMAQDWLGLNITNRNVRPPNVDRFAQDLVEGAWPVTGDSVKFAGAPPEERLIDGQHRLQAIIVANVPMHTLVVRGLSEDVVEVIDTGAKRKLSDVLKMRGEINCTALAAALPVAVRWDEGDAPEGRLRQVNSRCSNSVALAYLAANPSIRDEVAAVEHLSGSPLHLSPRIMAPFARRVRMMAPDELEVFLHKLASGADLPEGDSILALRAWAIRQHEANIELPVWQRMGAVCKAWIYWREGYAIPTAKFGFRPGETFPDLGGRPTKRSRQRARERG